METFRSRMRRFTSKFSNVIAEQEDLSEADIPSSSRGGEIEILNDIVSTEAEYDGALKELSQDLLPLFQDSTIFNASDVLTLFGNVEDLYDLHHTMFGPELYHRLRKREKPASVTIQTLVLRFGQLFIDYSSSFDAYFSYVQNRPKSEALMRERATDIKFVLNQTSKSLGKFQELLKVPIRRLDVYLNALESVKNCKIDVKLQQIMYNAGDVINRQFRYGEALWALERLPIGELNIKDQMLFRIDDLTVKKEYHLIGRPKMRCVFLFTKCIIITKRVPLGKDALPFRKGGEYEELKLKGQIDSETIETRNLWMRDICEVLGLRKELQLKTGEFGNTFLKNPFLQLKKSCRDEG
uniref:DH domain-containing protein n=1 Tax=Syphacia muris TaxID=451379 RepID=A0A0N5AIW3_9BILA